MNYTVYINPNRGHGELGFAFVGPLIAASPGIFQTIMGLFGGGQKAQYQGLPGITSGGNQLIGELQQILGAITPANAREAVQVATQRANQLNDPAIFYPAKKGKDATALQNFKSQASQLIQQIQQAAAAAEASGVGQTVQTPQGPMIQTVGPNGQIILVPASSQTATVAGIPVTYLLAGGAGLLVLVLLLRQ